MRHPSSQPNPASWRAAAAGWACACLLGLAGGLSCAPPAQAQNGSANGQALERRVKAAFIYKFLGYAEFPANAFDAPAAPVVIGVANADEMAAELTRIASGRSVGNRPIAVRALREGEAAAVHLLFVGGSDCARVGRIIRAMQRSLLVVSECDNGLSQGSVINFRIVDERVRFDVALDAAERNNVKLSSRLLTVANHVQKGTP